MIFGRIETTLHGRCFRLLVSIRRLESAVYSTNVGVVRNSQMTWKTPDFARINPLLGAIK
jgi:hypothetical protein